MSNQATPRRLAQRIIRLSERGNQPRDSQLEDIEVIDAIIDIAHKLAKVEMYRERKEEGSKGVDSHYIFTFRKQPVKVRTSDKMNYVDIPARYARLPWNAGVQSIRPNSGNFLANKAMIPIESGMQDVYASIIGSLQKQFGFQVEGDKAYFTKRCDNTLCDEKIFYVDITLVTIIGDISPDTPLNVPPELHHDIVLGALDMLGPTYGLKRAKDKINDNNPDTLE